MDGNKWKAMVDDDEDLISDSVSTTDSFDDSTVTAASSSSSLELVEDASSCSSLASSFSPTTRLSQGPLYELSELMAHLPIKRGLSRHFHGKSQSFTSLSNVRCVEDLAKRESPLRKKMKSCKSYEGGLLLDMKRSYVPKTCSRIISKKVSSRGGAFPLNLLGKRNVLDHSCNPRPHLPV